MAKKRTYGQSCAAAHALDLVGDRWALLVVRDLILGPKRFSDLRAGLLDASPNVLSQRLRDLEQDGVVRHRKLGPPSRASVYELTDWGRELEPVIGELGRWGARSPLLPEDGRVSVDSEILALRGRFDPDAAGGLEATYEIRLGGDSFRAEVTAGSFEVHHGEASDPTATIETDPETFAGLFTRRLSVDKALKSGDLKLSGKTAAIKRFFELFPLPEQVSVPAASVA
jgi:DNA-binding HxlR family transcriptional regulator